MQICSLVAAVALPVVGALRHTRHGSAAKSIGGVPVFNYESRNLQLEGARASSDTEYDWFLAFDKQTTDAKLNDFCKHDVGKAYCKRMGHPSEGGSAYVMMRSNEDMFRFVLESNSDQIMFAEPDLPMEIPEIITSTAAAPQTAPWNLAKIRLSESKFTGAGVHIYVLDTGTRSTHEEFGGRALPTLDTLAGNGDPVECKGDVTCATDYHGHGTHTAGTAGGRTYGAAPESNLYILKTCCGQGGNTLGGMEWVTINGIRPAIMTVSLGSRRISQAAKEVVDNAVASGVTVFVAAGNSRISTCGFTYGFIPSAISVGASDSLDARAAFSNYGGCNDLYAPGVAIPSGWKDSDNHTRTISGTSMACPLAAGVGALILQENSSLTPEGLLEELLSRATKGVLTNLKPEDPNLLLQAV